MATILTIGEVAQHFGCRPWQIRRAILRGLLEEPPRVGAYRVFTPEDLPRIQAALRSAGYLPEELPA
jgi:DNA-binding transcriptional MerR regulator